MRAALKKFKGENGKSGYATSSIIAVQHGSSDEARAIPSDTLIWRAKGFTLSKLPLSLLRSVYEVLGMCGLCRSRKQDNKETSTKLAALTWS